MQQDYHFAVISAETAQADWAVNANRTDRLRAILQRIFGEENVFYARGRYEGVDERSYLVRLTDRSRYAEYEIIEALAGYFNQDSWLEGHTRHSCWLNFPDGRRAVHLGYWREVPESVSGDHTRVFNRYYQCVPEKTEPTGVPTLEPRA